MLSGLGWPRSGPGLRWRAGGVPPASSSGARLWSPGPWVLGYRALGLGGVAGDLDRRLISGVRGIPCLSQGPDGLVPCGPAGVGAAGAL